MFFFFFLIFCAAVSCSGKRPKNGTLEFDFTVRAIQKNAEVQILSGEEVVASGKTDESGVAKFSSLQNIGGFVVKVCGGTVGLVSSEEETAWNGCMKKKIKTGDGGEIGAIVDFVSTFIERYNSETSEEEWYSYLDISGDAVAEVQSSLTDSTKRYLWIQGLAKVAETVSKANGTVPETQFSTENLLNLLFDDLADDNVINGSTGAKFGTLPVNAAVLKGFAADAVSLVSDRFSETELKEWSEKIRTSEAAFLGEEIPEKSEVGITITVYPEGQEGAAPEYFSGNVIVEAAAAPENAVISLICFANGEKISDSDEETAFFKGVVSTLETEAEEILIRCEASDGIDVKVEEKSILVNNDAPLIEANFYEAGTNIVTGTEENRARNRIDLKAEASHEKYVIEDFSCSLENYTMTNTANSNYQYFAVIDTTELPEGKNVMHCVATVNRNKFAADFDFYVKNTVSVNVKPFVVHALSKVKSVDADCGNGFKGHYTGLQGISLKRGQICTVVVTGGVFQSVTLSADEKDVREFGGTLSAVVIPESEADIVVTPVTTIDEIVYSSRVAAGDDKTETFAKSKESLLRHFSDSFKLSGEPKNTKSMDESTKYFILLAGLENLAYFLEMQIDADHGAYGIGNILDLLRDDYSDLTFDGKKNTSKLVFGTENKLELDSNFFRYYYATAVKRFLQSAFNKTGITNIGSVLNQISMNSDQFLFPAGSETIAIESDGPAIEISSFRNLFEYIPAEERESSDIGGELGFYLPLGEESEYKTTKYPYFAKAFLLNFTLKPENGNFIDLNSVGIGENDSAKFEYTRLLPAEIRGDGFTNRETEFSYLVEYDDSERAAGEKQIDFTVSAADAAFNGSSAAVKSFLDSKAPVIQVLLPENTVTNGKDSFKIEFEVTDNALSEVEYCIEKILNGTDEKTAVKCAVNTFSDLKTSYLSEIDAATIAEFVNEALESGTVDEADGRYEFRITATDKAGNRRTEIREFETDTTPPGLPKVYSYNSKNNIYLFAALSDNFPQWPYLTSSTSVKVDVAADGDTGYWNVRLICCPKTTESYGFLASCSAAEEEIFKKNDLHPDETAVFEGLPDTAECRGTVQVCDKAGNCTKWKEWDYTDETLLSYMNTPQQHYRLPEIWFAILNDAPEFDSYTAVTQECRLQPPRIQECFFKPQCAMSKGELGHLLTSARMTPHIMLKYVSAPETVKIRSAEGAWNDRYCSMRQESACEQMFFCDLTDSVTGINNIMITACDILNNCTATSLSLNMDMNTVEPVKLRLSRDFFTEKTSSKVSWTNKSGITYTCKISKEGDTSYSQNCTNGQTIKTANLNGTGLYTVTVESSSSTTSRTDKAQFIYFNTSDLNTVFTPVVNQFLRKNDRFKFDARISDPGNFARITKIEFYLYGLYKNGQSSGSGEYLVTSTGYSEPVSSFSNTVSAKLNLDVYGQLRNLRAKITFADGAVITRNTTGSQAGSFLYCLLGSGEKLDDVRMDFSSDQLLVTYRKPDCLTEKEYKLSLKTRFPSQCSSIPLGKRPEDDEHEPFSVSAGSGSFSVSALHTLYSAHKHCIGDGSCMVGAGCYADIHAFSKETEAVLTISATNKSFNVRASSFDWNNVPVTWDHVGTGTSCSKCSVLPASVSCESGESRVIVLK